MKIRIFLQAICIGMALVCGMETFAQSQSQADTTAKYFQKLVNSPDSSDKVKLEAELYQLLKSNKEPDWLLAQRFFYQLKKVNVADSVATACKKKFPLGQLIRNDETKLVYDEPDATKKEALYKAWISKFPPEKFGTDRIVYDYVRNAVSTAYAKEDDVEKALLYANMIETPAWKGEGWAGTAGQLVKIGHLNEAAELYKKAAANSLKYRTTNRSDNGAQFAAAGYVPYCSLLADIYLEQNKYEDAFKYIREAHDSSNTVRGNVNATYAKVLMALGKNKEAFVIIDEAVKEGQATVEMKADLKKLYIAEKGSDAGYEEYLASVNKILADKVRKELVKQMINKPAPGFSLKDVDGKNVSLQDYAGKIVVLDFWATWCGPCKRSFPAMKTAVNRFKDNPDVKFLFIHTWERDDSASFNAKKYVDENQYPFTVLMDKKDAATGVNKVVDSYKVNSIPAKFVIDRKGNIRFSFSGFSGGEDAAVEEIAAMVELANKG